MVSVEADQLQPSGKQSRNYQNPTTLQSQESEKVS
jgi:hypothetical protein